MPRTVRLQIIVFAFLVTISFLWISRVSRPEIMVRNTTPSTRVVGSLAPYRHVTKSLSELGKMDEVSAHILMLNAVPKSGSEILVLLIQWLQGWNNFRHVRLKGSKRKLSNLEQEEFVDDFYKTVRDEAVPLCFDRNMYFINFTRFDKQSPTYINLIRDPADYLISRFNHLMGKKVSSFDAIEDCILKRRSKCDLHSGMHYDLAIPYFCGQDPRCALLNDDWALDQAKSNVERYYSVVGILEEVNATLQVFEKDVPFFFKGVQRLYYRDLLQPFHRNRKMIKASDKFRKYAKLILAKEYEFYEWSKRRLFRQLVQSN
ncbi:PREDICTED: uronyl 2-sulfotransferase-like [Nicrophorus vespilloides]|uniref:Uronyl 2-sulfotransferase-like n=1 Tax=Nicrophorus vespilloides TaxID=110193 RepID=A0ABM1M2Q4_NICVS|nr:PREDICTED: uronyl 2-sulfotransferase-like [Nicrophorus vespilloides]XP_017768853.1 PREDICTED: uronyl 2-sulfotransferase-like [Nicrophorus vespilloides]XP_017768854.1 PREDICTED: uronyl 2-sulfotransferase-like [Nicrophorus vespilloides]